jgi:hypothetical protein
MRSVRATYIAYLALITAGLVLYTAVGYVRSADSAAPGETVQQFAKALDTRDGEAACNVLAPDTASRLEDDRKKPCDQAVLEIATEIQPKGEVSRNDVAERSAVVSTTGGDQLFLDKTDQGWRISSAGCRQTEPGAPYDCEVQA